MDGGLIALGVCALYLVVTLAMGVAPSFRVSSSVDGYVAADRSMQLVVLYFVLGASIFSSFAFLGGPGWAYSRGGAAFYILAYGVVGMTPLYFLGPRARRIGARHGFVTQAELLRYRFRSPALSVVLAVLSVLAFVPYLTLQMKGAGYILETISDGRVSAALGAAVTYGIVVIYVLASGVLGVGWTNTFQGVFMMVLAWFLGLWLPWKLHGGVGEMFRSIADAGRPELLAAPGLAADGSPWTWAGFSSAVVVSALGFTMWPHLFMKSYAAASDRVLRLTVVLYPTFQIFLVPILLIGFAGVTAFPGVEPADTILPFLLTRLDLSPLIVGLVCAGTLAASMSSGDSILHAAASVAIRDGVRVVLPDAVSRTGERGLIRILVVVLAAVSYGFAVTSDASLVQLLLLSYGGVAQIFPPMVAAFYWRRATGPGALAGLLGGSATSVVFALGLLPSPIEGMHEGVWGLVVNVALLVGVSLATAPDPVRAAELRDC